MGFSRQEYWSGSLCPPPGHLPNPGIEPSSLVYPELAEGLFTTTTTLEATQKSVQFSAVTRLCSTLCNPMDCGMPGLPVYHRLPEFTQTHVHWVSDAIQPSHPLSSPSPPPFNLSQNQGLFRWISSLHQVAKYWSFNFSISPSNEYSGLIAFKMDWFDLLAVQGTLKSLLQHHSSKASILCAQLSL